MQRGVDRIGAVGDVYRGGAGPVVQGENVRGGRGANREATRGRVQEEGADRLVAVELDGIRRIRHVGIEKESGGTGTVRGDPAVPVDCIGPEMRTGGDSVVGPGWRSHHVEGSRRWLVITGIIDHDAGGGYRDRAINESDPLRRGGMEAGHRAAQGDGRVGSAIHAGRAAEGAVHLEGVVVAGEMDLDIFHGARDRLSTETVDGPFSVVNGGGKLRTGDLDRWEDSRVGVLKEQTVQDGMAFGILGEQLGGHGTERHPGKTLGSIDRRAGNQPVQVSRQQFRERLRHWDQMGGGVAVQGSNSPPRPCAGGGGQFDCRGTDVNHVVGLAVCQATDGGVAVA